MAKTKAKPKASLRECPFCGGAILYYSLDNDGASVVKCSDCDAAGPPSECGAAIESWNRRAKPPQRKVKAKGRGK